MADPRGWAAATRNIYSVPEVEEEVGAFTRVVEGAVEVEMQNVAQPDQQVCGSCRDGPGTLG